MKTAIIGLGNIGSQLAINLTSGGENVIVADRTLAKAEKLAGELGGKAEPRSIGRRNALSYSTQRITRKLAERLQS
jgi:Trk K+ transport system NAD-binding subunit